MTRGLLVTRVPHPRRAKYDTPRLDSTHENCIFAGPGIAAPLRRGELRPRRGKYESRVIKSGRTPAGILQLDKGVGVFGQKIHTGIQCFTVFDKFFLVRRAQITDCR